MPLLVGKFVQKQISFWLIGTLMLITGLNLFPPLNFFFSIRHCNTVYRIIETAHSGENLILDANYAFWLKLILIVLLSGVCDY